MDEDYEKARSDANNAKNVKAAAQIAQSSGNPYAVAAGTAVNVADKVTGGKASETLGKAVTAVNKHSGITGKATQKVLDKAAESGASEKAAQVYSIKNGNTPNKNTDGLQKTQSMSKNNISSLNDSDGYSKSSFDSMKANLGNRVKSGAQNLFSDRKNDSQGSDDSILSEDDTKGTKKVMFPIAIGCIASVIFSPIALIILLVIFASPTSSIMSNINTENSENMKNDSKLVSFFEKVQNFLLYGDYAEDNEIIVNKLTEVYEDIAKEKGIAINLPLLTSTLFSDAVTMGNEYDEENQKDILNAKLTKRLDYAKEVALLQVQDDYVIYKCNVKEVNGEKVYYKEITYDNNINAKEGECNSTTVGTYIKEAASGIVDSDTYYDILKNNKNLLAKIYGNDKVKTEEDLEELIGQIMLQKESFSILFEDEDEENASGNIPLSLFADENINFTSPLKGSYGMTSSFGNRTGVFAGMHKGIDMVSSNHNIYAAGDGVVTALYTEKEGGNVLEITHTTSNGEKYISQYAHLSKFLTQKGAKVKAGDIIGIMGDTGITSGVHLHFQVWKVSPYTLYNPKNVFSDLK